MEREKVMARKRFSDQSEKDELVENLDRENETHQMVCS
jgi:hypothetical protein